MIFDVIICYKKRHRREISVLMYFTRLFRWHPSGGKLVGKWQSYKATGYESRNGHVYKELDGDYLGDVIESYSGVGE